MRRGVYAESAEKLAAAEAEVNAEADESVDLGADEAVDPDEPGSTPHRFAAALDDWAVAVQGVADAKAALRDAELRSESAHRAVDEALAPVSAGAYLVMCNQFPHDDPEFSHRLLSEYRPSDAMKLRASATPAQCEELLAGRLPANEYVASKNGYYLVPPRDAHADAFDAARRARQKTFRNGVDFEGDADGVPLALRDVPDRWGEYQGDFDLVIGSVDDSGRDWDTPVTVMRYSIETSDARSSLRMRRVEAAKADVLNGTAFERGKVLDDEVEVIPGSELRTFDVDGFVAYARSTAVAEFGLRRMQR